jgi:DNA-directed RNA polymerase beta' subunit
MGFITNNERYNQIIDIWTHTNAKLTHILMNKLSKDKQGFNPVYMMPTQVLVVRKNRFVSFQECVV